jgi:hypothetical protein
MNWKHLISAMLLLMLVPVSAFGLSCEVTCGLASMTISHHQFSRPTSANASSSMNMSQTDCHSMHQTHHNTVSQSLPSCKFASQSCDDAKCASDHTWLIEQKPSIPQPELSWSAVIDVAIQLAFAPIIAPLSSPTSLPPPSHRAFTVLRI